MTRRTMSDEVFEEYFDNGGDTTVFMTGGIRQPGKADSQRKININMPVWLIDYLDGTAKHLAVNRQAVINMWLAERVDEERAKAMMA